MVKTSQRTVLMLAPSAWPDKGGVEVHVREVSRELNDLGWQVLVLVPPKKRPAGKLGLVWLWGWMLTQLPLFAAVPIIHIHDVFLWFWPVWPLVKLGWFLTGKKGRIITTFHGWEGDFPPTAWQKFNKWLAQKGSNATVAVGKFLEEFYPIQPTKITYGGVRSLLIQLRAQSKTQTGSPQRLIYVGRLASDTGLPILLQTLKKNPDLSAKFSVDFWGEGSLRTQCQTVGITKGWVQDPGLWLQQPNIGWVVASGYLSVLEALAAGQRVLVLADNPLKQAYYATAPFKNYLEVVNSVTELEKLLNETPSKVKSATQLTEQAEAIAADYSWNKVAKLYLHCYVS